MSSFALNDITITVKRSVRRKTMALQVRAGQVSLLMPKRAPLWLGKQFATRQQAWLQAKLNALPVIPQRQFSASSLQPYLGKDYLIQLNPNVSQRRQLMFDSQQFSLKLPYDTTEAEIKNAFLKGYRQLAEEYLPNRCHQLAKATGLSPKAIRLRRYKARWGSCNSRGEVQLNWLLIQAPAEVIDYVIIHELCHLRHMNHSPAFWQLVAKHEPNYRQHRDWLKQHGQQIMLD